MIVLPAANGHAGAAPSSPSPAIVTVPDSGPVFDVAAIHLHNPEPHEHNSIWSSPSDGHFKAANVNLIGLIRWAFAMPETRILGAPGWANSTWFNIEAKADSSVDQQMHALTPEASRLKKRKMVQALLAGRFGLVTHFDTKELPIYALVAAKGGPKLGVIQSDGTTVNSGNGRIEVQGSNSVALLAEELEKIVGRVVVDRTGIEGRYNLTLKWVPDDGAVPRPIAPDHGTPGADSFGPSIFTALQEQLGLKLMPQKGLVQVLVIDHVEMPSEN
jgi:uncharacterized protein (TIGR03435 family)